MKILSFDSRTLLLAISVCSSVPAFADIPPPPSSTTQEISAQTAITQRGIEEVLAKLSQTLVPGTFKARDYWAVTPQFRKNVENALIQFEETLRKDILEKAAPLMANYNSIVLSKEISDQQKAILLGQQQAFLASQFKAFSELYAKATLQAYRDTKIDLFQLSAKTVEKPKAKDARAAGVDWKAVHKKDYYISEGTRHFYCPLYFVTLSDSQGRAVHTESYLYSQHFLYGKKDYSERLAHSVHEAISRFLNESRYARKVTQRIRSECQSQICVGLRAADTLATLEAMQTLFSTPREMRLADGFTVTIQAPSFPWGATIDALRRPHLFGTDDLPMDY